MAFCSKCGSELKEGVKFCSACGMPVNPSKEIQKPIEKAETAVAGAAPQSSPYRNNYQEPEASGIRKVLKHDGGSALFLIYIIISAVFIIFSVIGRTPAVMVGTIISLLPGILSLIGMILGYADARSSAIPEGKGIGLYKAGKILSIVYAVIVGILCILVLLFGAVISGSGDNRFRAILEQISEESGSDISAFLDLFGDTGNVATIVVIIVIVIIAAVLLLAILYELSLIHSANAIRSSLQKGRRAGHIRLYPAVMMIIGFILSVLNIVRLAFESNYTVNIAESIADSLEIENLEIVQFAVNTIGVAAIVSAVLIAVKLLLGAIVLIRFRNDMRDA